MSIIRTNHSPYLLSRYGSHVRNRNPSHRLEISKLKHECWFLVNGGMQLPIVKRGELTKLYGMMGSNPPPVTPQVPPPSILPEPNPHLPEPNPHNWLKCIFGPIIAIILPLWKEKGGAFQKLEDKVGNMAGVVKEAMKKGSTDVANNLPANGSHNGGPHKGAALFVEQNSKEVEEDAEETLDFIQQADELNKDVEALVEHDKEDHKMKNEDEIDQEQIGQGKPTKKV
ncbi:uncharacterized protein LOC143849036 [Tasmannia lanceolata]|uniref:uncharacterized protein LOC143849036 n=1 Tax=Tasmannia lanceolata TaxID=3420 RepID=UPI004063313D